MAWKQWSRLRLILVFVAIGAIACGLLILLLPETPESDEAEIAHLIEAAGEEFNDHDWDGLAELFWPEARRPDFERELEGYGFLQYAIALLPTEISNLSVSGNVATCHVSAKGKYAIGNRTWSREFTAVFRKHEGKWLIDAEATREGIIDQR